jgi:hypothetical protein
MQLTELQNIPSPVMVSAAAANKITTTITTSLIHIFGCSVICLELGTETELKVACVHTHTHTHTHTHRHIKTYKISVE